MKKTVFDMLLKYSSARFFAMVLTLRAQILLKKQIKFTWISDARQFEVSDTSQDFWLSPRRFSDRLQGFISYRDGFEARAIEMAEVYSLDQISFVPGDIIVDCGANYGDLELALAYLGLANPVYYAFEPDPNAFKALKFNSKSQFLFNTGLWDSDGSSTFFVAGHADSSFIRPPNASSQIEVTHSKLDTVLDSLSHKENGGWVRLLKIEAEGAEPEVIRGSLRVLTETDHVSVDAGRERGLSQESTLVEVTNLLFGRGFAMKRLSSRRMAILYTKSEPQIT